MTKKIALAIVASSLFFACGGDKKDDDKCTLDTDAVCGNKQCGTVQAKDSCDVTQTVTCGNGCNTEAGEICQANMCISQGPGECTVSEADKELACKNRCAAAPVMNSCNELVNVDCPDNCGSETVCNQNSGVCVNPSTCEVDLESACSDSKCGPLYHVKDSCGLYKDVDCGCNRSGYVDQAGNPIPEDQLICIWGQWYPRDKIEQFFIEEYCEVDTTGHGITYCGTLELGAIGCGETLSIDCPASNCVESDTQICTKTICAKTSVCSGARDQLSAWLHDSSSSEETDGGIIIEDDASVIDDDASVIEDDASVVEDDASVVEDDASVVEDDGGAKDGELTVAVPKTHITGTPDYASVMVGSDKIFANYDDVKVNTTDAYEVNMLYLGVNGISESTLIGADIDLSGSKLDQDTHYDFTCAADDGQACFGVHYFSATRTSSKRIIYEARSGTLNLTKAGPKGFAGEVSNASMVSWMLVGDSDVCSVDEIGFSFDFPATNDKATNTVFPVDCAAGEADLAAVDGKTIAAEDGSVQADANHLIMTTYASDDMLFVFGINALKKLRNIDEALVMDSYVDFDTKTSSIYCNTEPDEDYDADGICVGFWMTEVEGNKLMLTDLYDMVGGYVFVDSVKDTLVGSVHDGIFQLPDVSGVCDAITTPISFSFTGKISTGK